MSASTFENSQGTTPVFDEVVESVDFQAKSSRSAPRSNSGGEPIVISSEEEEERMYSRPAPRDSRYPAAPVQAHHHHYHHHHSQGNHHHRNHTERSVLHSRHRRHQDRKHCHRSRSPSLSRLEQERLSVRDHRRRLHLKGSGISRSDPITLSPEGPRTFKSPPKSPHTFTPHNHHSPPPPHHQTLPGRPTHSLRHARCRSPLSSPPSPPPPPHHHHHANCNGRLFPGSEYGDCVPATHESTHAEKRHRGVSTHRHTSHNSHHCPKPPSQKLSTTRGQSLTVKMEPSSPESVRHSPPSYDNHYNNTHLHTPPLSSSPPTHTPNGSGRTTVEGRRRGGEVERRVSNGRTNGDDEKTHDSTPEITPVRKRPRKSRLSLGSQNSNTKQRKLDSYYVIDSYDRDAMPPLQGTTPTTRTRVASSKEKQSCSKSTNPHYLSSPLRERTPAKLNGNERTPSLIKKCEITPPLPIPSPGTLSSSYEQSCTPSPSYGRSSSPRTPSPSYEQQSVTGHPMQCQSPTSSSSLHLQSGTVPHQSPPPAPLSPHTPSHPQPTPLVQRADSAPSLSESVSLTAPQQPLPSSPPPSSPHHSPPPSSPHHSPESPPLSSPPHSPEEVATTTGGGGGGPVCMRIPAWSEEELETRGEPPGDMLPLLLHLPDVPGLDVSGGGSGSLPAATTCSWNYLEVHMRAEGKRNDGKFVETLEEIIACGRCVPSPHIASVLRSVMKITDTTLLQRLHSVLSVDASCRPSVRSSSEQTHQLWEVMEDCCRQFLPPRAKSSLASPPPLPPPCYSYSAHVVVLYLVSLLAADVASHHDPSSPAPVPLVQRMLSITTQWRHVLIVVDLAVHLLDGCCSQRQLPPPPPFPDLLPVVTSLLCMCVSTSSEGDRDSVATRLARELSSRMSKLSRAELKMDLLGLLPSHLLREKTVSLHLQAEFPLPPSSPSASSSCDVVLPAEHVTLDLISATHLHRSPCRHDGSPQSLAFFLSLLFHLLRSHCSRLLDSCGHHSSLPPSSPTTTTSSLSPSSPTMSTLADVARQLQPISQQIQLLSRRLSEDDDLLLELTSPSCWFYLQLLDTMFKWSHITS